MGNYLFMLTYNLSEHNQNQNSVIYSLITFLTLMKFLDVRAKRTFNEVNLISLIIIYNFLQKLTKRIYSI